MKTRQQILGQFMTPPELSNLFVGFLPGETKVVIDYAAGDAALLKAAAARFPNATLLAAEKDEAMFFRGRENLPTARWKMGDGLSDQRLLDFNDGICAIGNPPFADLPIESQSAELLFEAFPGLRTLHGRKRAEIYFLAKALVTVKKRNGYVVILMPMGFGDGDVFQQFRQILMENYSVDCAVEIPADAFPNTEVRTILLCINTGVKQTEKVRIAWFNPRNRKIETVAEKNLSPGSRLDSRFYRAQKLLKKNDIPLSQLGVSITRGTFSRKEAETMKIRVIHTTDLNSTKNRRLHFSGKEGGRGRNSQGVIPVFAEPGDILISRTGRRVSWKPVILGTGNLPITDHVFRVRAPKGFGKVVKDAFFHPKFEKWIEMNIKGACASVLTKAELMKMPIFDYRPVAP